jgi:hypothetical protein
MPASTASDVPRGSGDATTSSMPTANDILQQLTRAANELSMLAIAWHLVVVLVAAAMLLRWRPSVRYAPLPLVAPVLSVFMVSLGYGNWFNAASFFVLAVALTFVSVDLAEPVRARAPAWRSILGIGLVAFGAAYPHFVDGAWYRQLYAAPIGVVPCPTLALIAGYTLLTSGHGTRKIPAVLAVWTTFYAAFGIAKLGVVLDVGLVVATFGLVALAVQNDRGRGVIAHAPA